MPSTPLSLQEQVLKEPKYLPYTMAQVKEEIDTQRGNFSSPLTVRRKRLAVKLSMRCKRPDLPEACTMSIVLNNVPISYIDWHRTEFVGIDGARQIGWHRHVWSDRERSCENQRRHLPKFNPATIEEFIQMGFQEFNIIVEEDGHDRGAQLHLS
jgi:hypothetical protein